MKIQPTKNRVHKIDALRGFALFGILFVNIFAYHVPWSHYSEFYASLSGNEKLYHEIMKFFFGDKFFFIFSFLFGYGFWMQYSKYQNKSFNQYWAKRMIGLLGFGILHVVFLAYGDILIPYAILGTSLLLFNKLRSKILIIISITLFLLPPSITFFQLLLEIDPTIPDNLSLENYKSIYLSTSYFDMIELRLHEYWNLRNLKAFRFIPLELSLFLIGIVCSRFKMHECKVKKAGYIPILGTLIITILYWQLGQIIDLYISLDKYGQYGMRILFSVLHFIHGMTYIIGFWILWNYKFLQKFLNVFSCAGRLSLTNYIAQSMFCNILFYDIGFGQYTQLTPSLLALYSTAFFIFQCLFSYIWLKKIKFGPLEYIWRKISYQSI